MEIEFDPEKSAKNEKESALPFELVRELEWAKARITHDDRIDYGEERFWRSFQRMGGFILSVFVCVKGQQE